MAASSLTSQTTRIIASRRCPTTHFRPLIAAGLQGQGSILVSRRNRDVLARRTFGSIPATTAASRNNNLRTYWRSPIRCPSRTGAPYTTEGGQTAQSIPADTYIDELQDLYDIAQDELEIANESTSGATIYAASDRETLREAFEDLENAYTAYTGSTPTTSSPPPTSTPPPHLSQQTLSEASADAGGRGSGQVAMEGGVEEGEAADEGGRDKLTNHDPTNIPDEVREEIKRRVGQRVREMKNAVEALEESANEG